MDDIVERLKSQDELYHQPNFGWEIDENKIEPLCMDAVAEIERLRKYEQLVQFIANDYWELSHDKIKWVYTDYKKRCRKLIEEDNE